MKIVNLGHASYLFQGKDISFVIDPYKDDSVPGLRFPKVSANYAFKSHDHHDHNALELVNIVPTDIEAKYETITVPHDRHNGADRGLNKIHIFYVDNLKIIHLGDLGCIPDPSVLEKLMNADVLLAPINGFYTISAEELYSICEIIKPRLVIPMHYYRQEDNSGYPDGGQIGKFKQLFKDYIEVNDNFINIDGELQDNKAIIFKKALQGGR